MTLARKRPSSKLGQIKKIVESHKNNQLVNRVYYYGRQDFSKDFRQYGVSLDKEKSKCDQLTVEENKNDSIYLYGFDQDGSHFELNILITSLYDDILRYPNKESRWRRAQVKFIYFDKPTNTKYCYEHKELQDYEERRGLDDEHAKLNYIKIGSISLETVIPYSYHRILFQGLFVKELENGLHQLVPSRVSISTHATCDKFDYMNQLSNTNFVSEAIDKTLSKESFSKEEEANYIKNHLRTMLEDRIDTSLMFEAHFQVPDLKKDKHLMWGAKCNRILDPIDASARYEDIEYLLVWAECGHIIHLSRPVAKPDLVYGMIHNTLYWASSIYGAGWGRGEGSPVDDDLGSLTHFNEIPAGTKIKLYSFNGLKENLIELVEDTTTKDTTATRNNSSSYSLSRARINGFDGWSLTGRTNFRAQFAEAQASLMCLNLSDPIVCWPMASEHLLGGKANSLVELTKLVTRVANKVPDVVVVNEPGAAPTGCVEVQVPRGVVISSVAYGLWLDSDPQILRLLEQLDVCRRLLAAKSYFVNPLSNDYLSKLDVQRKLSEKCDLITSRLVQMSLPKELKEALRVQLSQIFGESDLLPESTRIFAVRSSALGEDSTESSAAGQLSTFLDVRGFESICDSIVKCWASQFEPTAVSYKMQSGSSFNWPMAVVVQELIDCRASGVAATCDPLSGNPRLLEITSNLGLGEGVVSGRETDTIRLDLTSLPWNMELDLTDSRLTPTNIHDCIVFETNTSKQRQLTDQVLVSLGNLLLWIKRNNKIGAREIEWGMTSGTTKESSSTFSLHLFQSRPLTNLDKLSSHESDFELDIGNSSPLHIVSRGNIGEVLPGTLCPLGHCFCCLSYCLKDRLKMPEGLTWNPYIESTGYVGRLVLVPVTSHFFADSLDDEKLEELHLMVGIDIHPDKKEKFMRLMKEKKKSKELQIPSKIESLYTIKDLGLVDLRLNRMRSKYSKPLLEQLLKPIESYMQQLESITTESVSNHAKISKEIFESQASKTLHEIHADISRLFKLLTTRQEFFFRAWTHHHDATNLSVHFTKLCMNHMSKQAYYKKRDDGETASQPNSTLLADFGSLMVGKTETASGDLSHLLDKLIDSLVEEEKLDETKEMSAKQLYDFLTTKGDNNNAKSQLLFQRFIKENGHRAYKEFDLYNHTWADDPSFIIKSVMCRIKARASKPAETTDPTNEDRENKSITSTVEQQDPNVEEIFERIESDRTYFRRYLVPAARRCIVRRELSKSYWVSCVHRYRVAIRHLGALLVLKGLLPSVELIYFVSLPELEEIIEGPWSSDDTSSRARLAKIIYKVRRRHQRTKLLDSFNPSKPTMGVLEFYKEFYKFTEGLGPSPSITGDNQLKQEGVESSESSTSVRGMTSCAGLVTARACVLNSLEEADQIQEGDILVTHCIDVSWTIYFFCLAGIVTELGGIISHGAVVAREYGIPTLCTATGCMAKFKTGQKITLDANKGICYLAKDNDN